MNQQRGNEPSFFDGLKKIANIIDNTLDYLIDKLGHKMTYAEYLDVTGECIDERIIKECKEKNLVCYGGKAKIALATLYNKKGEPSDFIMIIVELFYKDIQGSWVRSEFKGKTPLSKFNLEDFETVNKINSFKTNPVEEITINPPKADKR
ncbi:MAG: hypothetical protein K6B74_12740 [Ruminococcus sp.]|nr:hypothetical protein [Ruminococcus sp.]